MYLANEASGGWPLVYLYTVHRPLPTMDVATVNHTWQMTDMAHEASVALLYMYDHRRSPL